MTLDEKKDAIERAQGMLLHMYALLGRMTADLNVIELDLEEESDDYFKHYCKNSAVATALCKEQIENYLSTYDSIIKELAKG